MADDIRLNLLSPEKGEIGGFHSNNDLKSSIPDHVTPDNLSRKLLLHKKTELSDFFQTKEGMLNIFHLLFRLLIKDCIVFSIFFYKCPD